MFDPFSEACKAFCRKAADYVAQQALSNVLNMKHNLQTLDENLKSLSDKASDVETEIRTRERCGRKKRKREVDEWLRNVESIKTDVNELRRALESAGFITRLLEGGKASQLNEQVEKLLQQSRNFEDPVFYTSGTMGVELGVDKLVGKAFGENLEEILKILKGEKDSKIGVYGMGGVGKTLFAKHVYNGLVKAYGGGVVWVTMSQESTITSLQDKIAHFLGVKLEDKDEEAFRASRLDRLLSENKISVLMLDEVWKEIDMKKVGFNFSGKGCRLLITTRSVEVCHRMGCKELFPVVKLGEDEAWKLFIETMENEGALAPELEEIAKSMVKLCDGLPIGIERVAKSMRGQTSIHMWKNASAQLKECLAGKNGIKELDEVFQRLKYSFDWLNEMNDQSHELNTIQRCFLRCSFYPNYQVLEEDLVRNLISDGLMEEAQVEQCHSTLEKLVNVGLLESCVNDDDEKCVKMHNFVRGMAQKVVAKGKYKVLSEDQTADAVNCRLQKISELQAELAVSRKKLAT